MRRLPLILLLCLSLNLCLSLLLGGFALAARSNVPAPALASQHCPVATPASKAQDAQHAGHSVTLVPDGTVGVMRLLIDGKEVLAMDAKGLHVKGNIAYSGVITDEGDIIKLP